MKNKKVNSFKNTGNILATITVFLAHVGVIVAIALGRRYFSIYPALIYSLLGLAICFILAIDVAYIIGVFNKDKVLKIITVVLTVLIVIVSSGGSYFLVKTNKAVSTVIGTNTSNEAKTETVDGVFVVRTSDAKKYTDLVNLKGKKIGYVKESTEGVSTIGLSLLDEKKYDYASITYETYDELIIALNDEKVDAGIFIDGYRGLYSKTADNSSESGSDFTGIISTFTDFYPFSKEVDVSSTASTKNISTDPFNILLIGWSRTEIGSKVGLADAIIVASVNPKTYTVSMMSIARDSYVPISCYGGTKDKINSARGTSRACFIKTVEDYTGMDMDFYMEADYEAVVDVVDALGGIWINNPVSFTLDAIEVPAGSYTAGGWQVLQFCRERHHMPNGDFDRQQHQKEVIIAIAEKLIKSGDITIFLKAIEAAGDKFSTNLTLNQLTGMFNMILQTKNYTGLKVSKLINFQQLRLTGYASWYYNYSMSLPLWIYKIYQGSYDESMNHAKEILGLNVSTSDQAYNFSFDVNNEYVRPLLYSETYNEERIDEPMPLYYANFVGYSYADAVTWAKENGVTFNYKFIKAGEDGYDESLAGQIVAQSIRYGMLVSSGTNTLTVMDGNTNSIKDLPDFVGFNYKKVVEWAEENKYRYALRPNQNAEDKDSNNKVFKVDIDQDEKGDILKIRYYVYCKEALVDGACPLTDKTAKVESFVDKSIEDIKKKYTVTDNKFTVTENGVTITYSINKTGGSKTSSSESKIGKVIANQSIAGGTTVEGNTTVILYTYVSEGNTTPTPTPTPTPTVTPTPTPESTPTPTPESTPTPEPTPETTPEPTPETTPEPTPVTEDPV